MLKLAPDVETRKKYFDMMTKQQEKTNRIVLAIHAYNIDKDSKSLEETLVSILKSDLKSELTPEQESEIKKGIATIDLSQKIINTDEGVIGAKIGNISKENINVDASQEGITAKKNVEGPTVGDIT